MLSNKIITSGVVVVIILAAVYIGNQVVRTTPQSGALGATQYKVVPAVVLANAGRMATDPASYYQEIENNFNKLAGEGWEYVGSVDGANSLVFKKN